MILIKQKVIYQMRKLCSCGCGQKPEGTRLVLSCHNSVCNEKYVFVNKKHLDAWFSATKKSITKRIY